MQTALTKLRMLTVLLVGLFVLGMLAVPPENTALAEEGGFAVSKPMLTQSGSVRLDDVRLEGLDGTNGSLLEMYAGKRYVVIVGRPSCGLTQGAIGECEKLLDDTLYSGIDYLVLDMDDNRAAFSEGFSDRQSDRMRFCSPNVGSSVSYSRWAWAQYRKNTPSTSGNITLPFMFLVESDGTVVRSTTGSQSVRGTMNDAYHLNDPSFDVIDAKVVGVADQASGRSLLGMVNSARSRANVDSLQWSTALEQTAMQRAAEIAVYYSHTRPNGTECFTVWPDVDQPWGENIAYGQPSAESVNTSWTNSPGHYANMVNSRFTTMAAACFVSENGTRFWVECFAGGSGDGQNGDPAQGFREYGVEVVAEHAHLQITGDYSAFVEVGETVTYRPVLGNGGFLSPDSVEWTSSDTSVATIEGGKLKALRPGETTVTASLKGNADISGEDEIAVTAIDLWCANVSVSGLEETTCTGNPITPKPAVKVNGELLVEGVDYTLSYSDNVEPGYATVTVLGKGVYEGSIDYEFFIKDASDATKAKQPMKVTVSKSAKAVKHSSLKKKAQALKAITVKGAKGRVSYTKVGKGSSGCLSVNKNSGKVSVKKRTPKGLYTINVKVSAEGTASFNACYKIVAVKVRVK